jgi:hypothetical protein
MEFQKTAVCFKHRLRGCHYLARFPNASNRSAL